LLSFIKQLIIFSTGTLLTTDCKTFPGSALYVVLCPIPNQEGSLGLCDSHCRCIHRAKWGRCETRPVNSPSVGFANGLLGNQWCRCFYDEDVPQGWTPNPQDNGKQQTYHR
jgi:hypothetical protein